MDWRNIKIKLILLSLCFSTLTYSMDRRGRLGAGLNNQLKNNLPALSFKIQQSRAFAIGGVFGYSSDDSNGGYGAGLKVYRNLFEEPQLHFYAAAMGALIKQNSASGEDQSGFQVDLSLGSEFSFTGLNSIGFSFEFGVSLNKLEDFVIETIGDHIIVGAVHFYF